MFVLQTLAMDTTEHQRKYKHNDNGHDTHNAGHTGLALIGILVPMSENWDTTQK